MIRLGWSPLPKPFLAVALLISFEKVNFELESGQQIAI